MLGVGLVGSRRIWPAQVGMPRRSRRLPTDPDRSSGWSTGWSRCACWHRPPPWTEFGLRAQIHPGIDLSQVW